MIRKFLYILGTAALSSQTVSPASAQDEHADDQWAIAIHGGAGTIKRENMTAEKDAEIRAALNRALEAGSKILREKGTAIDAITAAIMILEDDPNFNAGKGAVFTWDKTNELDASIMEGVDLSAGAVAGINGTKNPILLARAVKEKSPHVMLSGAGANQFSREQGLEQVPPEYYKTPRRLEQIERVLAKEVSANDVDYKFGTVGAVAMDTNRNMAAGTSTGGMTGKRWGRIGDSPIIGAGTYADDKSCAVSATGDGEYFIRVGVAQEICTRIRLRWPIAIEEAQKSVPKDADGNYTYAIHASEFMLSDEEVQQIADDVMREVGNLGGTGGIILTTPWGQNIYSFNTPGMYRGKASSEGDASVAIYGDEDDN